MKYTKEELEQILENDFLLNPKAFSPGRTNNDMVDSMLICFILDREWTELFAKWMDNYVETVGKYEYVNHCHGLSRPIIGSDEMPPLSTEQDRILEHYRRVKDWIDDKVCWQNRRFKNEPEMITWKPGNIDLMSFAINY